MSESIFSPLLDAAIEFASQWHEGTYRKSSWRAVEADGVAKVPTFAHVTAVALMLARMDFSEETVAAAFLHDAVEDENRYGDRLTLDAVRNAFGDEVADLVGTVSEIKKDQNGHWLAWKDRKKNYLASLENGSNNAKAISLADKIHNLWTMNQSLLHSVPVFSGSATTTALSAGPDDQLWYFQAVVDVTRTDDAKIELLRERLGVEIDRFKTLMEHDQTHD